MSFLELAKNRYTTKSYNADKKISDEVVEQLAEILRLSPSSINSQPWQFIIVSDEAVKNQLAEASFFNKEKIQNASHLVVFNAVDSLSHFEQQIQEYLPQGAIGYYQQVIKPRPEAEVKAWLQKQVYIALGFFLSACADLGIDSTAMEGIEADKYQDILKLEHYKPLLAVAIGYRNPEDSNQLEFNPKQRLEQDKVVKFL